MINPDVFFWDYSDLNGLDLFVNKNLDKIGLITAGLVFVILFKLFWEFTRGWK